MKKSFVSLCLGVIFFCTNHSLTAEGYRKDKFLQAEKVSESGNRDFSLGLAFFARGDYFRAETEFMRLAYVYAGDNRSYLGWRAKLFLNRIKLIQGRNNEALVALSVSEPLVSVLQSRGILTPEFFFEWRLDLAYAFFQTNIYKNAAQIFYSLENEKTGDKSGNIKQRGGENINRMAQSAEAMEKLLVRTESGHVPIYHRPWLAALMSFFVPGLGQAYNGEYGLGLLSFTTVGTLGAISYYSFTKGNPMVAYMSLYLAVVFHGHNINRAIETSWHYNQHQLEKNKKYFEAKITQYLDWWPKQDRPE